jgi:hypothetical protein
MTPRKAKWKVSGVRASLAPGAAGYDYRNGVVATPKGYVWAYTERNELGGLTTLRFIWNGRAYVWTWNTYYSDRYIATLSGRMVREVTSAYGEL